MFKEKNNHLLDLARKFRKSPTKTEEIVWQLLRRGKLKNLKFKRQHPISGYIVDFYCPEYKLIIEIDGLIHDNKDQRECDKIRQETLGSEGYEFVRIRNDDIEEDFKVVYKEIESFLKLEDRVN